MNLTSLGNTLWAAAFVGHAALLLVLLLRYRSRHFLSFTCFIAIHIFVTITLFLISRYGTRHAYSVTYWGT